MIFCTRKDQKQQVEHRSVPRTADCSREADCRYLPQAHSGNDADLVLPVHVAQQHGHHGHDAAHR